MYPLNYQKRRNVDLFRQFENRNSLFLSQTQNYIPIYNRFFSLNDQNFNSINLNHRWHLVNVKPKKEKKKTKGQKKKEVEEDEWAKNIFSCTVKNVENEKTKNIPVFFKMAPLLDPFKFLIGKYNLNDKRLFSLPKYGSTCADSMSKYLDPNNAAYVDGLFLYLANHLKNTANFMHGVEFYGSFLAIKNDFTLNIFDDLDYLINSEFFVKNQNTLFKVDNYDHIFLLDDVNDKKPPLIIGNEITDFTGLIELDTVESTIVNLADIGALEEFVEDTGFSNVANVDDCKTRISEITTLKSSSSSSCSSRTSHTHESDESDTLDEENLDNESMSDIEEQIINAVVPRFPVQIISMEECFSTLDELIFCHDLSKDEWLSAFMQIIMTLLTYQKVFAFTHNDLHTCNIMYNQTQKKYIFYLYNGEFYRVPTFGRVYKIIDFGRSIFRYNGKVFCSDSFQANGDAASQYNTEPYFNESKPRLDPNMSFDLCRLACSIYDSFDLPHRASMEPPIPVDDAVKQLIFDWCQDDKGLNIIYKTDGTERYPDFKLYKMIARCVHGHTPMAQLARPEFRGFLYQGQVNLKSEDLINIDAMAVLA